MKRNGMLLGIAVLVLMMMSATAFAGKSGKAGEPGSSCYVEGCYFKFNNTPYLGTITLECATDGSGQCREFDCSDSELPDGTQCVEVSLSGTIMQFGNHHCTGNIPDKKPWNMGEMEKNTFQDLKPQEIRACIIGSGFWDANEVYTYWFSCQDPGVSAYFEIMSAGKVTYLNQERTKLTAQVVVKEVIPICK